MKSLFCCPLCGAPLDREEQRWSCPNRHSFDRAAAGYVHLLPANKKHSQDPGDDKAMVAARSAFLEKGWYAPLRGALCQAVAEYAVNFPDPVLVDSGCGEGYYTVGLFQALSAAELSPQIAGVDLSKAALRRAAKRLPEGEFAVASAYHLPLPDKSADVLVDIFSPLAAGAPALRAVLLRRPLRTAPVGDEGGPLLKPLRKPGEAGGLPRLSLAQCA